MTAQTRQAVVKIQRMARDAVGERSFGRRRADVAAPDRGFALAAHFLRPLRGELGRGLERAGQRAAERIDQCVARTGEHRCGNVLSANIDYKFCKAFGQHGVPSGIGTTWMQAGALRTPLLWQFSTWSAFCAALAIAAQRWFAHVAKRVL